MTRAVAPKSLGRIEPHGPPGLVFLARREDLPESLEALDAIIDRHRRCAEKLERSFRHYFGEFEYAYSESRECLAAVASGTVRDGYSLALIEGFFFGLDIVEIWAEGSPALALCDALTKLGLSKVDGSPVFDVVDEREVMTALLSGGRLDARNVVELRADTTAGRLKTEAAERLVRDPVAAFIEKLSSSAAKNAAVSDAALEGLRGHVVKGELYSKAVDNGLGYFTRLKDVKATWKLNMRQAANVGTGVVWGFAKDFVKEAIKDQVRAAAVSRMEDYIFSDLRARQLYSVFRDVQAKMWDAHDEHEALVAARNAYALGKSYDDATGLTIVKSQAFRAAGEVLILTLRNLDREGAVPGRRVTLKGSGFSIALRPAPARGVWLAPLAALGREPVPAEIKLTLTISEGHGE